MKKMKKIHEKRVDKDLSATKIIRMSQKERLGEAKRAFEPFSIPSFPFCFRLIDAS